MSKNARKLEKESLEWKRKWEKSNATLIELATEKKERDDHAMRCNKQVDQLQKLLRALQNERSHLYKVIKENNVEVPPLPVLPPEPEHLQTKPINSVADKDKMEIMSKNCAELKQTLANLQNQMKILNLKGAEAEEQCKQLQVQEESLKKKQKKKSKSKKNQNNAANNGNNNNNTNNKESSPVNSEDTNSIKDETPAEEQNGTVIESVKEETAENDNVEVTTEPIATPANVEETPDEVKTEIPAEVKEASNEPPTVVANWSF